MGYSALTKYQLATIDNHTFIVNTNGSIQHSKNTQYKEDGDALITTTNDTTFAPDGQFKYEIGGTYTVNPNLTGININEFVNVTD